MNRSELMGEVIDSKQESWNNKTYTTFVVEAPTSSYTDKATGERKTWKERIKCNYEHPNFQVNIGDTVFAEGTISNRSMETKNRGKVWVTEVKCKEVMVLKKADPRKYEKVGPAPMDYGEF